MTKTRCLLTVIGLQRISCLDSRQTTVSTHTPLSHAHFVVCAGELGDVWSFDLSSMQWTWQVTLVVGSTLLQPLTSARRQARRSPMMVHKRIGVCAVSRSAVYVCTMLLLICSCFFCRLHSTTPAVATASIWCSIRLATSCSCTGGPHRALIWAICGVLTSTTCSGPGYARFFLVSVVLGFVLICCVFLFVCSVGRWLR